MYSHSKIISYFFQILFSAAYFCFEFLFYLFLIIQRRIFSMHPNSILILADLKWLFRFLNWSSSFWSVEIHQSVQWCRKLSCIESVPSFKFSSFIFFHCNILFEHLNLNKFFSEHLKWWIRTVRRNEIIFIKMFAIQPATESIFQNKIQFAKGLRNKIILIT